MNVAFKTFCLENGITDLDPEDEIFRYDPEESKRINKEQPWKKECVDLCLWKVKMNSLT